MYPVWLSLLVSLLTIAHFYSFTHIYSRLLIFYSSYSHLLKMSNIRFGSFVCDFDSSNSCTLRIESNTLVPAIALLTATNVDKVPLALKLFWNAYRPTPLFSFFATVLEHQCEYDAHLLFHKMFKERNSINAVTQYSWVCDVHCKRPSFLSCRFQWTFHHA
jgi:hypothetical protein